MRLLLYDCELITFDCLENDIRSFSLEYLNLLGVSEGVTKRAIVEISPFTNLTNKELIFAEI